MANKKMMVNHLEALFAVQEGNLTKAQVEELKLMVEEYLADHWRDDDSPQAEKTFGVCHAD